jgi:peptidoglycan/LPS O-acetylase OafA/YrhL
VKLGDREHVMPTLGAYTGGRGNNFNLMRFFAAMLVIVSHSFVLATGDASDEPWHTALGITPGSLAVEIFFVASGFLITASLFHWGSFSQFAVARVLRIYPGLTVAVLSSVLVFGIFFSTLLLADFLSHRETLRYVVRNVLLIVPNGLSWTLPGVFENHVSGPAVNGSLWTLVEEVRMYGLILGVWVLIGWCARRSAPGALATQRRWIGMAALALALLGFVWHFAARGEEQLTAFPRLMALFFTGSAMYVWRNRIPASWPLFLGLLGATLLATLDRDIFGALWLFTLPYMVLFFALVPAGPIRGFNRIGDFSYGLYIYAFPVQKIVVALIPGIGPWGVMGLSTVVTVALAVLSWHLVEQPALRLKDVVGRRGWGMQHA